MPPSSFLSSPDSSSSSPVSSISSVSLSDDEGEGTAAAPCTAVTFTVCHSDKGELEEVV